MDKSITIHDNFLRSILADKEIAIDYFRAALPAYVADRLDFTTLTQLPDTYVSKELRRTVSDIVYSCSIQNGTGNIKISLLIEHKSYIDKYTPIQIGSYIFSGWLKQLKNRQEPSLIIPVLLYHGKKKWRYRTLKSLFNDLDADFRSFVPDYEYIYHNLGEISADAIEALHNKFLAASLLALKMNGLKEQAEKLIPRILTLARESGMNLQTSLIVYIFVNSGLKEEKIVTIIDSLPFTIKETVMNTLDIFIEKGRKIGLKEEREKAIRNLVKQSLLSDEQIAAALEVPVGYVAGIRKEMESGEMPFDRKAEE